ncbi:hypothetical protein [Longimicrobium sp.]|uniref:hypothetical protein n=1 Tax=Longimicrobium sp. TaxID=2029185 RepID=UPI003B3B88E9
MRPWKVRALRRFVGTAVMLIGGQAFIHRLLYAPPDLPSHRVDRVVVVDPEDFVYEIRDPAAVRRLVAFIRAPKEKEPMRMPDFIHRPNDSWSAAFYRGERVEAELVWAGRAIIFSVAHNQNVWYFLSAEEGAELQRLTGRSSG